MIATGRLALPSSRVRLSAGRLEMSDETQALCFLAGANSVFAGDKLLTTENAGDSKDAGLFAKLGLQLLIVTPLQKVHVIEPYVSAIGFVDNPTGAASRVHTLTIEEFRERQRRLRR